MDYKDFIRPNRQKIILFVILYLIGIGINYVIRQFNASPECLYLLVCETIYDDIPFGNILFIVASSTRFFGYYLISCIMIGFFRMQKKK